MLQIFYLRSLRNVNGNTQRDKTKLKHLNTLLAVCIFFHDAPRPKFPGYTTLRHDRPYGGGGALTTLVKHHISFTNTTAETVSSLPTDPTSTLELQSFTLRIQKQNITLINICIPPSSPTDNFQLNIQQLNTHTITLTF